MNASFLGKWMKYLLKHVVGDHWSLFETGYAMQSETEK